MYRGHGAKVNRIHCEAGFLFSTSYDKTARVWLLAAEEDLYVHDKQLNGMEQLDASLRVLKGHSKSVYPIAYIPLNSGSGTASERDLIITGSADCTIRSWSLLSGECLKVFEGHTLPIVSLALDPSKREHFLSGGGDGLILIWDSITGDCLLRLDAHEGAILSMVAHKRMLFTCSVDRSAKAWVIEFGDCTRSYTGHDSAVSCVRYFKGIGKHKSKLDPYLTAFLTVYTGTCDGVANLYDSKSGVRKFSFASRSPEPLSSIQA